MPRRPTATFVRDGVSAFAAILLSVLGFPDSKGLERYFFLGGVLLLLGLTAEKAFADWRKWRDKVREAELAARFIEPLAIRKRCHGLLELLALSLFPDDASLQLTVFVPDRPDGDFYLVPIVRFEPSHPKMIDPTSRARFRVNSGSLISEAWQNPEKLAWKDLEDCDTIDKAKGFFTWKLGVSKDEVDRLSEHTLLRVKCLGNIALRSPIAKHGVGIVSLSSGKKGAFDLRDDDKIKALSRHLEMVANLLAPIA